MNYDNDKIELDFNAKREIDNQIDLFIDEFMTEEYKGRDHILAREHYGKVFHELLPKYLRRAAPIFCKTMEGSQREEVLS